MKAFPKTWSGKSGRRSSHQGFAPRNLGVESLEARQMLYGAAEWLAPVAAEGEGAPVADFSLDDVNATSPTSGQQVSPRDYMGQVSGWYFGSAL